MSGKPCSTVVGISGSSPSRRGAATARARRPPEAMCGRSGAAGVGQDLDARRQHVGDRRAGATIGDVLQLHAENLGDQRTQHMARRADTGAGVGEELRRAARQVPQLAHRRARGRGGWR